MPRGGHAQLACQHHLTCPLGSISIPPKTTAPVVPVVGCLWGLKPLFLVISYAFQNTALRLGTGVEDLNELWPDTAADRQAPDTFICFSFH